MPANSAALARTLPPTGSAPAFAAQAHATRLLAAAAGTALHGTAGTIRFSMTLVCCHFFILLFASA
jgi:hypothetical protein